MINNEFYSLPIFSKIEFYENLFLSLNNYPESELGLLRCDDSLIEELYETYLIIMELQEKINKFKTNPENLDRGIMFPLMNNKLGIKYKNLREFRLLKKDLNTHKKYLSQQINKKLIGSNNGLIQTN